MGFHGRGARTHHRRSRRLQLESLESRKLLSATAVLGAAGVRAIGRFGYDDSAVVLGSVSSSPPVTAAAPAAIVAAAANAADDHGDQDHDPIRADDPAAPFIYLQHDKIPNFAQQPTISAVRSGNWSDPRIWSAKRVPQYGDVVQITGGTTVEYTGRNTASIKAIGVNPGATLRFSSKVSTQITVGTLVVFEGGTLQIGQATSPVSYSARTEIAFDGAWLNTATDPSQYGVGLLGFGKVTVYGAYKSRTWLRLAAEPKAGDAYLTLETKPVGWQAGDTLFLPDTRQIPPHMVGYVEAGLEGVFGPTWEEVTIDRIEGNRVYLRAPVAYEHLGARNEDGELEFLPHVALVDRNVVFRSANPAAQRGHVLLGGRADVDIRYARFHDLGRTQAFVPLDSTTRDASGNVTHVGTNQIGRYSVHLHHLVGSPNPTNAGHQFRFIGNTLDNGRKWGMAIHGTSFGLIQDNVVYKMQGGGFVTEDGSEIENDFYRNFAGRIRGTNEEDQDDLRIGDTARSGVGFWMRRAGNTLRDNVVANASFAGVAINGGFSSDLPMPAFRGALISEPGESITLNHNPPGAIKNVEVYGRGRGGLWIASPTGSTAYSSDLVVRGLRVWHTDNAAIEGYRLRGLTIADSVLLGSNYALGTAPWRTHARPTYGVLLRSYETSDVRIVNTRIANHAIGIRTPEASSSRIDSGIPAAPMRIEKVELANAVNVVVPTLKQFQSLYEGKATEIVDTVFRPLDTSTMPYQPTAQLDIEMQFARERHWPTRDLLASDVVIVRNFNRVRGDDFRVYYLEQRADYVPPATDSESGVGSPAPGMTNEQLWTSFGVALAGSIAPCSDTRDGIVGFACPLAPSAASPFAEPRAASSISTRLSTAVDESLRQMSLSARR